MRNSWRLPDDREMMPYVSSREPCVSEVGKTLIGRPDVDVSIIMPCLNEAGCLPACIANAREALQMMRASYGLSGEIVIADNGSTDGSPAIAESLGARCIHVTRRGYGAALAGG